MIVLFFAAKHYITRKQQHNSLSSVSQDKVSIMYRSIWQQRNTLQRVFPSDFIFIGVDQYYSLNFFSSILKNMWTFDGYLPMSEPPRHDSTHRIQPIIKRIKNTDVCSFEDVIVLLLILLTTNSIFGIFLFDCYSTDLICFSNTQRKLFKQFLFFWLLFRFFIFFQRIFFMCREQKNLSIQLHLIFFFIF